MLMEAKVGDLIDVEELLDRLRGKTQATTGTPPCRGLIYVATAPCSWPRRVVLNGGRCREDGIPTATYGNHMPTMKMGADAAGVRSWRCMCDKTEKEANDPIILWYGGEALVAQQFENTLVRILLAAGAVSFVLALSSSAGALTLLAFVEPLVIFLILVVNAAVGVWQETNAEKALEALRRIQSDHAAVVRDAEWAPALPVRDLVPGDVIMVRVGDKVPADMRASGSSRRPSVERVAIGETNSVNKAATPRAGSADIAKDCMVFAGTTVVNGAAPFVVHTGMAT
ncbi:hypothetical protein ZWY2020_047666 [Hordeum vulgare]|nr:hypothetical protein ZWY2020_047666 [Hordeum vulgare]